MSRSLTSWITIIGGGIVGKAAAVALANIPTISHCFPVNILDAGALFAHHKGHRRASFLTPSSISLFRRIGIWSESAWPVTGICVTDTDIDPYGAYQSPSSLLSMVGHLSFQQSGDPDGQLGCIAHNDTLESALDAKLRELEREGRVVCHERTSLQAIEDAQPGAPYRDLAFKRAHDGSELEIRTNLVIGADGAKSSLRSLLGLPWHVYDYEHVGIVATLRATGTSVHENSTAYQRFLSTGPIALLPLSKDTMSLVWSVPKSFETILLKQLSAKQFTTAINLAINASLSDLVSFLLGKSVQDYRSERISFEFANEDDRASFPMRMGLCPKSIATGALLVGDAAHVVHPLAGQGLNLGLADVLSISDLIQHQTGDFGLLPSDPVNVLEPYHKERGMRNTAMVLGCHTLFHLFTTRSNFWKQNENAEAILRDIEMRGSRPGLLDVARRAGLSLLNSDGAQWIQGRIMKAAMWHGRNE